MIRVFFATSSENCVVNYSEASEVSLRHQVCLLNKLYKNQMAHVFYLSFVLSPRPYLCHYSTITLTLFFLICRSSKALVMRDFFISFGGSRYYVARYLNLVLLRRHVYY